MRIVFASMLCISPILGVVGLVGISCINPNPANPPDRLDASIDPPIPIQTPFIIEHLSSTIIDPQGGSHIDLVGSGFVGVHRMYLQRIQQDSTQNIEITDFTVVSDTLITLTTPAISVTPVAPAGSAGSVAPAWVSLHVVRGVLDAQGESQPEELAKPDALEIWSPTDIPNAQLFDASSGIDTYSASPARIPTQQTHYEWQRLTPEISPNWRVRDGNTLTWLPSTQKFWMVAGWNGYQAPVGFSTVDPDLGGYPAENTSDEVWSSSDGITWNLELPHQNGQFERRHSHNTVLWKDQLWMIGGDFHQGYENHDVVSSADGIHWVTHLGPLHAPEQSPQSPQNPQIPQTPQTPQPPWSKRVLQTSGVYQGRLWTMGGQSVTYDLDETIYHNDVWVTDDGIHWQEVVSDAPASATRWGGCGVVDGIVEFKGRMWLVGCARERADAVGHSMFNEVWSTTDGITWQQHATPPWAGKIWHNVVVWDDKLWILFGFTYGDPANGWPAGNANEVWYSEDGETWQSLPQDTPVPGSHAQGVAVRDDFLLMAGGNYGFGFGLGEDKSAWRLYPYRGQSVQAWQARAAQQDTQNNTQKVYAQDQQHAPIVIEDAFGKGRAGLHFDGSTSFLQLPISASGEHVSSEQPSGRSIFWIAQTPYTPIPYGWTETVSPVSTVVGGADASNLPTASVGLSDGQLLYINREPHLGPSGEIQWTYARTNTNTNTNTNPLYLHFAGVTHALDGTVRLYQSQADLQENLQENLQETVYANFADYSIPRSWSRIGGGLDGLYEGPHSSFSGTLGAVIIVPSVLDAATIHKLQEWAKGRFGTP